MSYRLVHSLRLHSALMDCDVAQLLSFHYGKLLAMNNLTATSNLSSGFECVFTLNLTANLNPMFDITINPTFMSMSLFKYFSQHHFFFFIYQKCSQSLLQVIILIASLWRFVIQYFTTCPQEVLSCQSAVSGCFPSCFCVVSASGVIGEIMSKLIRR